MEVFPDPERVSTTRAFKWFQMNVPSGYKCKETSLTTCDDITHYWTVTYVLEDESTSGEIRSKISKWLRNRAKLTTVLLMRNQANRVKCQVGYKPHQRREEKNALWQYILPCIREREKKPEEREKSRNKTKVDLTKNTPNQCQLVDVNGDICKVTKNVIPKKLLFGGRNITRKLFGRSRMNKHFLSQLVENMNRPLIWVKNKMQNKKFHTADPGKIDESSKPPGAKSSVTTHSTTRSSGAMIPCDYSNIERKYQLSKLKHTAVFTAVQKFVALKCYQRKSEPIAVRSTFNRIAAANEISANGLPVDESLVELFQQYCKEAGINSDDVDLEESRIRSLARYI